MEMTLLLFLLYFWQNGHSREVPENLEESFVAKFLFVVRGSSATVGFCELWKSVSDHGQFMLDLA